jgi:hypothetical protein
MIRPFWRRSTVLFLVLSLTLIAIKLLLDVFLTDLPLRDQAAAFTWTLVLAIIAIGFAGLLAERASGFPDPLTDSARDWRGIRLAVITGAIYGLITIGMYVWAPGIQPAEHQLGLGSCQVALVDSVLYLRRDFSRISVAAWSSMHRFLGYSCFSPAAPFSIACVLGFESYRRAL